MKKTNKKVKDIDLKIDSTTGELSILITGNLSKKIHQIIDEKFKKLTEQKVGFDSNISFNFNKTEEIEKLLIEKISL
jgi:hypothetical protein